MASNGGKERRPRAHRELAVPGRDRIFQVSASAPVARRQRRQRAVKASLATVLLATLVIGGIVGFFFVRDKFFVKNPHYALQQIEVHTDGSLPREAITKTASLELGTNLFLLKLEDAGRRLESLPQVEKADLRRNFPATVIIDIIERKPVAWLVGSPSQRETREEIVANPGSLLIDSKGALLHIRNPAAEHTALPIVRGCPSAELTPGGRVQSEAVLAALKWLSLWRESSVAMRFSADDLDVSRGYSLVATDRSGLRAIFAVEGYGADRMSYAEQFAKLEAILLECERTGQHPVAINLMVSKNTPVTFAAETPSSESGPGASPNPESSETPAATPRATAAKPPKPKPTEIPVRKALPVHPRD